MPVHYIMTGLSMSTVDMIQQRMLKETVFRSLGLFLLGSVGLSALFAFQAYRSARASLSRVQAFSDTVIHHMPSGLVTLDAGHGISSMNREARQMFGPDLEEPLPEWLSIIETLDGPGMSAAKDIQVETSRGKRWVLETTASPILTDDGSVCGHVLLFKDITQVRELKRQVETNRRLAAIGKLAAGVAHEIRNPLSSIKGFATYLAKQCKDRGTDQETARIMIGEVERINRSITQLLEFAKPMAVSSKPVEISSLVRHSLRLAEHDLNRKDIQTQVDIRTARQSMTIDPDRMNQVLLNLYMNAVEAMDDKGLLRIRVQDGAGSGTIEIEVADDGRGMTKETVERIFDPYYTTRPDGTGLGLAIVHRIVENLGGQIRVESVEGSGSTFIITLPSDGPGHKETEHGSEDET